MEFKKISVMIVSIMLLTSIVWRGNIIRTSDEKVPTSNFITISDIHLNGVVTSAASFGCDTTEPLFGYAMDKFDSLIDEKNPKFILYLGDLPVHQQQSGRNCNGNSTGIPGSLGDVLAGLRAQAQKHNVPLLYLPGNNDGFGGDYSSFTDDETGSVIRPFTQDPAAKGEWPIINGSNPSNAGLMISQNAELGFYSAYPLGKKVKGKNLRVLMLNTVIFCCSTQKSWPVYDSDDGISQTLAANLQLNWMKQELKAAKKANDAVIISMHIPPGLDAYGGNYNWLETDIYYDSTTQERVSILNEVIEMVQDNADNIVGLFTSHTHMEELKGFYDTNNQLIELAISTPGVSINHDNNPGMKTFEYDSKSYELMDFTTYYAKPYLNASGEYAWDNWGDNQYSYSFNMGCAAGVSMLDCMKKLVNGKGTLNQSQITIALDSVYVVKSPKGGAINHLEALDVRPVNTSIYPLPKNR